MQPKGERTYSNNARAGCITPVEDARSPRQCRPVNKRIARASGREPRCPLSLQCGRHRRRPPVRNWQSEWNSGWGCGKAKAKVVNAYQGGKSYRPGRFRARVAKTAPLLRLLSGLGHRWATKKRMKIGSTIKGFIFPWVSGEPRWIRTIDPLIKSPGEQIAK